MQKITPCLWFDTRAEEAAQFYTSIFAHSRIVSASRYGEGMPLPAGTVMTVVFELDGQEFIGLNGGPMFKFTEAVSFTVNCRSQQELDDYWAKLSAGGKEVQCGWLKDKFGLSWQIVPAILQEMMSSKDAAKKQRVMEALMKMVKLDIATLQRAFDGTA
jgi:predicted 3-demethylubiquinone-9 3-methyltransferase (glyoxalase superfamily)